MNTSGVLGRGGQVGRALRLLGGQRLCQELDEGRPPDIRMKKRAIDSVQAPHFTSEESEAAQAGS